MKMTFLMKTSEAKKFVKIFCEAFFTLKKIYIYLNMSGTNSYRKFHIHI
jgi:hypothetical protein